MFSVGTPCRGVGRLNCLDILSLLYGYHQAMKSPTMRCHKVRRGGEVAGGLHSALFDEGHLG